MIVPSVRIWFGDLVLNLVFDLEGVKFPGSRI